jgi:type VI secretion system FHA domain protein
MGAVLVIEVEATGERRRHPAGRLRLGRAAENDWVLPDPDPQPSLSRRHCVIEATADGFTITDLGSTNGTRLNGQAMPPHTPTPLAAGDRLQLGRHALHLAFEEERADLAPAEATLLPPARPLPAAAAAGAPGPVPALDALLGGLAVGDPAPPPAAAPPSLSPDDDPLGGFFDEVPRPVIRSGSPPREEGTTPGDHAQPQLEAFAVPAAKPTPPPPPLPSPPPADEAAVLRAFLEGAGLDARELAGDPVDLMRDAGRAFAGLAAGLRDLLATRALVKDHAGVARTVIGAIDNNPLKYSSGRAEAVRALLVRREAGYLPPLAAVEAGFGDLKAHELALLEGVQAAVQALLSQFDPARLEARLADASALALLLQGGKRARLWELYTERYGEIAEAARVRFMGDMDRAFAAAYERKVREIGASRQPKVPQ